MTRRNGYPIRSRQGGLGGNFWYQGDRISFDLISAWSIVERLMIGRTRISLFLIEAVGKLLERWLLSEPKMFGTKHADRVVLQQGTLSGILYDQILVRVLLAAQLFPVAIQIRVRKG